jgi:hypothetical protein
MTRGVGGHGMANLMTHIKGIDFPADKQKIVDHARHGEGPDTDEVVEFLEKIPEKEYDTPADIMKAMGDIDTSSDSSSSDSSSSDKSDS